MSCHGCKVNRYTVSRAVEPREYSANTLYISYSASRRHFCVVEEQLLIVIPHPMACRPRLSKSASSTIAHDAIAHQPVDSH